MLILSPADRAALWQQTIASRPQEREGMLRVLAKEMQEIVGAELDVYFDLDEQFEETLRLLDRSGLIGRDDLRRAFEVVGLDEPGERGIDAREVVLILAGLLEETAASEPLDSGDQLAAHELAGCWREQAASKESPEPEAMLSVAEVAAHFGVTPQGVYKWCEAAKIEFERTPGGGYRIPAAQFDWARGQDSVRARRRIAERLMAKHGAERAPGEEEMVAAMRKARRGG
jgi:excisionase family DNA binding protein